jgi:hypothetical protein
MHSHTLTAARLAVAAAALPVLLTGCLLASRRLPVPDPEEAAILRPIGAYLVPPLAAT